MRKNRQSKTDLDKLIEGFEYFVKDDGRLGAILPYYAPDHIRLLDDWKGEGDEVFEYLNQSLEQTFWPISGEPSNKDQKALFTDVEQFIRDHVFFVEDSYYGVAASWAICTWIKEPLRIAPRPIFYGTTQSGKTRAINTMKEIVYRGYAPTIPTPATLYALIERYRPTLFIDEYQSIQNLEKLNDIEAVFKSGYEKGGTVPRMNPNTMEPVIHRVYGFMGLGTKGKLPPEDLVNRAIIFNMQQKPRGSKIARRIDEDRGRELRGRLLGFRLQVLMGERSLTKYIDESTEKALQPLSIGGKNVELGDRPIDLAETLLTPTLIFECKNSILNVIARCQYESKDELINTMEGRVFYALQECYRQRPTLKGTNLEGRALKDISRLSTLDVSDQLNADVTEQEGRDTYTKKDRIETHSVTSWLKTLGFTFHRGTANKSFFEEVGFERTYRTNQDKYGVRESCPDLREQQQTIAG